MHDNRNGQAINTKL